MNAGADARKGRRLLVHFHREPAPLEQARPLENPQVQGDGFEREFVSGARARGSRSARLLLRYVLPNALTPIIVVATLELAFMIIYESALSFLGLGVQPPTPTWGWMLSDGRNYVATAWWLATFPGLAIMLTVLAVNLLGDWLRDTLDPRLKV